MCSRAHAIFTLPEGASLGSFTRLKVKSEVSEENISVTHDSADRFKAQVRKICHAESSGGSYRKRSPFSKGRVCTDEQPTLSPKSYCAAFSWKIGRSYDRRIKPDAENACICGTKQ